MEAALLTGAPCVSKCYFGEMSLHGLIYRHTGTEKESLGMPHLAILVLIMQAEQAALERQIAASQQQSESEARLQEQSQVCLKP